MFWRKKKKDITPYPTLCSTVCVVWNNEEDIAGNAQLYCDSVPIIFDITKVSAIQADVEFKDNGSISVGNRTLLYLVGADDPLIIDQPYNTFSEYFNLLKSNEVYNAYNQDK
jgi:hypothetical protein